MMHDVPHRDLVRALAPMGGLRVTINLGNPVLANRADPNQEPTGVSVDLARMLAKRLDVPLQMIVLPGAGKAVEAMEREEADVGFFAADPARATQLEFTPPYLVVEGGCLVPNDSPLRALSDVDVQGVRVTVGTGSVYDLLLTRRIKKATLVRAPTSPEVVDLFMRERLEVAAGVKRQLQADCRRYPGYRLLDGNQMMIRQAVGVRRGRGPIASEYLSRFIEDMKAEGVVRSALLRHNIPGATVAR